MGILARPIFRAGFPAHPTRKFLTNNAILLTRNESDFRQIVELQTKDWSKA
jgi:hypothetical protein